ncbi:MAG: tRNA adenylyl-/cytidylyl-transferase [Microgenomates group bacterium GW2011_GWA2_47_8]|nr:MAG: tRNA adenylyl-/cytidylyl-transferase [Microgenomates group bacterium GW2011_GWA2_47_8]
MMTLPKKAQDVIDTLKNAGFEAYAVGGSVRDLLLDRPTKGWDFTTNATPEDILKIFPDSFYDNQFGTVGIKVKEKGKRKTENGEDHDEVVDIYEVTTYRSEKGYTDHRHPDHIAWGKTIEEDLSRRDFTINAIAFDGKRLLDPYNGQGDIKEKIIRAVGTADDRFKEDALRIMRAVRIATERGFMIEETTLSAIKTNVSLLSQISIERITNELLRILASEYPADGILLLKNSGILQFILPEFEIAFTIGQKSPKRHHIYDVGTHSVMALKFCPSKDPIVRLATLLHDIGKPKTVRTDSTGLITFFNHEVVGARMIKAIAAHLRLSKKDSEKIYTLVRWHQFSVDERQTDSAIRRFIRRVGRDNLNDMLALRIGDRLGGGAQETSWRLELYKKRLLEVQKQPFTVHDLKVNGYDVMTELGVKPGPIIGGVLDQLFAEVEEGKLVNQREALLTRMRELKSTNLGKVRVGKER